MKVEARLEIRDVRLNFGEIEALRGVDCGVPSHGITALIGPNGAGKTALLNTVSGIYRPQSGEVLLDGEDLVGLPPHAVAKAGVGRSFQHLELFPRLTVTENLLVARDFLFSGDPVSSMVFYGPARRQEMRHREAVESIVDFFELWPYRDVLAKTLPYGVQKIVGFARAMASEPKLLLLDEPGSGLTRDEKEDLARFLLRLRDDRKIPILWIEHDLDMVLDLADRIYALDLGRVIASGDPGEIRDNAAVAASYVG
ncbi:MAG: ABC transporter ATP-binding protein [Defluviicoccus sp.]|nr:ABC transporter ATP-binding protein [Defluviicoccus sp.]